LVQDGLKAQQAHKFGTPAMGYALAVPSARHCLNMKLLSIYSYSCHQTMCILLRNITRVSRNLC